MRYLYLALFIFLLIDLSYGTQFEIPGVKLQEEQLNTSVSDLDDDQSIPEQRYPRQISVNSTVNTQNNESSVLNVEVTSDVYSEKDGRVLYCPKGNYMVVRNRIYLNGPDLDKVQKVKYLLHPTFSNPVAESNDPTNDFEAWIWTWGGFPIKATITTQTGQIFEKDYDFTFKNKFEDAERKGIPQVMECND